MRNKNLQRLSTLADVRRKFGKDCTVATDSANNKVSKAIAAMYNLGGEYVELRVVKYLA